MKYIYILACSVAWHAYVSLLLWQKKRMKMNCIWKAYNYKGNYDKYHTEFVRIVNENIPDTILTDQY